MRAAFKPCCTQELPITASLDLVCCRQGHILVKDWHCPPCWLASEDSGSFLDMVDSNSMSAVLVSI